MAPYYLAMAWKIKSNLVGEDKDLDKQLRVLNRIVRWKPGIGLTYEPDPRHAEILIREMGFKGKHRLQHQE